jgi:hypothetical protein
MSTLLTYFRANAPCRWWLIVTALLGVVGFRLKVRAAVRIYRGRQSNGVNKRTLSEQKSQHYVCQNSLSVKLVSWMACSVRVMFECTML